MAEKRRKDLKPQMSMVINTCRVTKSHAVYNQAYTCILPLSCCSEFKQKKIKGICHKYFIFSALEILHVLKYSCATTAEHVYSLSESLKKISSAFYA